MAYLFPVTKIQKFCTHDGPGIRTTVFFKGCPLRCQWCHNPETCHARHEFFFNQNQCILCGACEKTCPTGVHAFRDDAHTLLIDRCKRCMQCTEVCPTGALEKCQTLMTAEEILEEVLKDRAFYGKTGGVTLSGGEPIFHGEETLRLLALCKQNNLHTALETCGYFSPNLLSSLVAYTDLFLWDVKDTCPERHKRYTGADMEPIVHNLLLADSMHANTILRCIMVKGINMDEQHYAGIAALYQKLKHCMGVELTPYHTYGDSKLMQLGHPSNAHPEWIPDEASLRLARKYLRTKVKLL